MTQHDLAVIAECGLFLGGIIAFNTGMAILSGPAAVIRVA